MSDGSKIRAFKKIVLDHYRKKGRHTLPWRVKQTPYTVFVSEMMLQQTQVERVIPKFNAFVKEYPSWKKLSKASLSEVYSLWSGLGYNRRAKYLRDAAVIVAKHGSEIPNDPEFIESLPGVGPYMKGAILAFAFGNPAPFVETNIRTAVTHHFFADTPKIADTEILGILEKSRPIAGSSARTWYAALMDYGSFLKKSGIKINHKSTSYTKQKKFIGSTRQLRGAILRKLQLKPQSVLNLVQHTKRKRTEVVLQLERLEKEGMVRKKRGLFSISN